MRPFPALLCLWLLSGVASAAVTTRVSVDSQGDQGPGPDGFGYPSISPDGRFVAFSGAANLVPPGTGSRRVYVHDRQTGVTTVLSPSGPLAQFAHVSADGRFVSFLVSPQNVSEANVYLADRTTGALTLVSRAPDGTPGNEYSYPGGISADGRYVSFYSEADNLIADDTNDEDDIFVFDRVTGSVERVSVASDGTEAEGESYSNDISADGRFVAFVSGAGNLVPDDTNDAADVFVHDRDTGLTERVSVATDGTQANYFSLTTAISGDGRIVTFQSYATTLVATPTFGRPQIYVHDRDTNETTLVSVGPGGVVGNGYARDPAISADGRHVGFSSNSTNLAGPDTNGTEDVFVHDRVTGLTRRVTVDAGGTEAENTGFDFGVILGKPAVANGGTTAYMNPASNLVPGDGNDTLDVFVHDLTCGNGSGDPGEECDDGNATDGDGCDRDCTVSLCTDGGTLEKLRLTLTHLGDLPADDGLRLSGELVLSPGTTFNPAADGLQLRLSDLGTPGTSLLDLSRFATPIPPGGAGTGCGPQDGWKASASGFSYRNSSGALDPPACTPGSAPGRLRLKLRQGSDGRSKLVLKVDDATFTSPLGPLRAVVVLGAGAAQGDAGLCGTVSLATTACGSSGGGTTLACRAR